METQNRQSERRSQLETYASKHRQELSAWNTFIDTYKGDLVARATIDMRKGLTGNECPRENNAKISELEERVAKLNLDTNPIVEKESFLSWGGSLIRDQPLYCSDFEKLPIVSLNYGFLENVLQNNLETALSLSDLSEDLFLNCARKNDEDVYSSSNLGARMGNEIVKIYAQKYFVEDVFHGPDFDLQPPSVQKSIISTAKERLNSFRQSREKSYPEDLSDSELALAQAVTHNLNTYAGREIVRQINAYERRFNELYGKDS